MQMFDAYDRIRRGLEGYRSIYDQINDTVRSVNSSICGQINDTAWSGNIVNKWTGQFAYADTFLQSVNRNLFDHIDSFLIDQSLLVNGIKDIYRPEALARVDEMLANFQVGKSYQHQFLGLEQYLAEKRKRIADQVDSIKFDAFGSVYSQMESVQKSLASEASRLTSQLELVHKSLASEASKIASRVDELAPLLSAQSNWVRTVHIPSSLQDAHLFAGQVSSLFDKISDFYSSLPSEEEEEEGQEEERVGQAISLANERLAVVFVEKSPAATLRKIEELLNSLGSGGLRLPVGVRKYLVAILINLISSFIFAYSVDVYRSWSSAEPPKVSKIAKREVRNIQKQVAYLPCDIRVVIARELTVRRGPGSSTPAVGRLYAGDLVVRIKIRNRSWSLVEFKGENGEVVLQGWV